MITQTYNIDLVPNGKPLIVNVSQYDKLSRTLEFNVYSSGVLFKIPSDTAAVIQGTKPDGTGFSYNMTVSGSKVSMDIKQQMTVFDGDVHCEILLTKNAEQLGSANFILRVEKAAISDETIISETDIPIFRSFASGGSNGQVFVHGEGNEGNWGNLSATNIKTSSGVAIKSVSGKPVTIADALQGNALGANATLEPIQDLHGYDKPWAGGAGKNLLKNTITTVTNGGVTATTNEDTSISFNGTPTQENGRFSISVTLSAGTYTASGCPSGGGNGRYVVALYKRNGSDVGLGEDVGDGVTFTITETSNIIYSMYFYQAYGTYNDFRFYPQIEVGSAKTSFEPYSNICPITGRTSVDVTRTRKNLFDATESSQVIDGVTFTVNDDGTVVANGTPNVTTRSAFTVGMYTITDNTVLMNGCPSGGASNKFELMAFANNKSASDFGSGNNLSRFSVGDTVSIMAIVRSGYTANNLVFKPMIRLASDTNATFEPYQGQSVTVNLGQTVYDGTLDVKTGTLTVDMAMVTLQDFTAWSGLYTTSGVKRLVSYGYLEGASAIMCDTLQAFQIQSPVSDGTLNSIAITADGRFVITPSFIQSATTVNEAKTMLMAEDQIHLVYKLATPQTIQLTPAQVNLLTGTNIISTNADDLSVVYYTTGKGDVEGSLSFLLEKTARNETSSVNTLAGSLAMVETSTATASHAVGDLIVFNSQLYKVTVAIASGESLTVGTNIASTSVGNELNNNCITSESLTSLGNNKYNMSFNIPNSGFYVATCNCRCYGGGTYPEIISVYSTPDCSGDAAGGGVTTKEYGFVSFPMYTYFERGTHYLSFHNKVASDYFNARVALFRIGNT